jgi:hypothetical protein
MEYPLAVNPMDLGQILNESYEYTREALWGNWEKWILLVISAIIFPLLMGYSMEVLRGKKPAPPLGNWGKLFIDGLKLLVTGIIYAIPVIILAVVSLGGSILLFMDPNTLVKALGTLFIGIVVIGIVAILTGLVSTMGNVRLYRTDRIGEAFNFRAILDHIRAIGWGTYIFSLLVMVIIVCIINVIIAVIPVVGWLISLALTPAFTLFTSRWIAQVYDSVPASP